jgi:hypothetical protein
MIDPTYLHNLVDGTLLVGFLTVAWKANRTLNRWLDVMKDYPPHRHFNGRIVYPKGMEPGVVENIGEQRGRA